MGNTLSYKGVEFVTGDKVTCIIDERVITDAKIYVVEGLLVRGGTRIYGYICQNKIVGSAPPDMLGYSCSWKFFIGSDGKPTEGVSKLKNVSKADVLVGSISGVIG